MNITFAPKGILQIDDARIIYRNFEGRGDSYNREGDRNFSLVIPDEEIKDALIAEGWNVKVKPPRDEDDTPFMTLAVKVRFNDFGPSVYLTSGDVTHRLDESTVHRLDKIRIAKCDLDIRPFDWSRPDGRSGRSAYLQSIHVVQAVEDRFAERFARTRDNDEPPFDAE